MDPFIAGCGVLLVASASYGLKVLKNHSDQKKLQALIKNQTTQLQDWVKAFSSSNPEAIRLLKHYLDKEIYLSYSPWSEFINSAQQIILELQQVPYADRKSLVANNSSEQTLIDFINSLLGDLYQTQSEYNQHATKFLTQKYEEFFNHCDSYPLTQAQRIACINDEERTLLIAGAGSGKTATIVAKAIYLIESGLAKPFEILMLAYNRDAAREMKDRIQKRLESRAEDIDVLTFHSFGNHFIKDTAGVYRGVTSFTEQHEQFKTFIANVIKAEIERSNSYKEKFVEYFIDFQVPVRAESSFKDIHDFQAFQKSHDLMTFAQELVKSGGELRIANLLFRWQIPYAYETKYPYVNFAYKPDFFITTKPISDASPTNDLNHQKAIEAWIEYFGIDCNGNVAPHIDCETYKEERLKKIELHKQNKTTLIELSTADLQQGVLDEKLRLALLTLGFTIDRLTDDQILAKIWDQKSSLNPKWQRFLELVVSYLPLYLDVSESEDEILAKAAEVGFDVRRITAFFDVFRPILRAYQEYKSDRQEIDFSDMITKSRQIIQKLDRPLPYKYVLVDEFQDLSHSRGQLLLDVLQHTNNAKLFAVGDDWQSIYRFAGSDLNLFVDFKERFPNSSILELDRTYRFSNRLNELSSSFVTKNPRQLKKTMQAQEKVSVASAVLYDVRNHQDTDSKSNNAPPDPQKDLYAKAITSWLEKISRKVRQRDGKQNHVMMIGRYQWGNMSSLQMLPLLEQLQKDFPDLFIEYKTAHSSKGLEADYVILVGLDNEVFPSDRLSDEIIEASLPRIEGFPFAEERRLLYVAMTRARQYLVILYDSYVPSIFALELAEYSNEIIQHKQSNRKYTCPKCQAGSIIKISTEKGNYFRCSNLHCNTFASSCPDCGSPIIQDDHGRYCMNSQCDNVETRCELCGFGFMRLRKNTKTGHLFYGCTEWSDEGVQCKHTLKVSEADMKLECYLNEIKELRYQQLKN